MTASAFRKNRWTARDRLSLNGVGCAALGLAIALMGCAPANAQPSLAPTIPQVAPVSVAANTPGAPAHALSQDDVQTWLDGFMPYAIARGSVAGAVIVVVKDGQVLVQKGYGYSDVAKHTPVDPATTMFRPGSVTKLFTWTAVMQQVEQGKIDLDRDVNSYIDFTIPPYQGQPVTMRNLMTHRAGFEEVVKDLIFDPPMPEPKLGQYARTHLPARIFPPGQIPAYSNYGATLAAYIVQRVSGEPFDDYIEKHIFTPLGMQHASFRQPLPPQLQPFMSNGYELGSSPPKPFEIVGAAPAGSSSVSGADMARFMIAHLQDGEYQGQRILQANTAHEMHETAASGIGPLDRMLLGFYEMNRNGHRVIGHDGDTQWFHSELALYPDDHVGFFLSLNSVGSADSRAAIRQGIFNEFTDRYFPGPAPQGDLPTATKLADGATLAGTYVSTRRSETNFLSMVNYLAPMKVSVGADGLVTASDISNLGGNPEKFTEIAPFVWRAVNGKNRLAALQHDGQVTLFGEDETSAVFDFAPVPWFKNAIWLLPALGAGLLALIATVLFWPTAAIVRRPYKAVFPLQGGAAYAFRLTRVASLLTAILILSWLGVIAYMLVNFVFDESMDPILTTLHWASIIILPLAVLLAFWNVAMVWRTRSGWRSWFARFWSVVIAFSCVMMLWAGGAFHLIATGVNY